MKKSILGVFGTVAVLALLFYEKNYVPETEDRSIFAAKTAENIAYFEESVSSPEHKHEIVKAAEFPEEGNVVLIEDESVPLAAIPEEKAESQTTTYLSDEDAVAKQMVKEVKAEVKAADSADDRTVKSNTQEDEIKKSLQTTEVADVTLQSKLEDLGGGVKGYYDEDASSTLMKQLNAMRSSSKDTPVLSAELNDVARRRALACVKDFSHNGMETAGECMAIGQQDAAAVITSWYASDEHRTYINDAAYTQAGTACIRYDKGNGQMQTVWVLVLN